METKTNLTPLIIEDIIPSRINKAEFHEFLKKEDPKNKYSQNASKLSLAYEFSKNCPAKKEKFSDFAVKSLMYGKSRIITESSIANIPHPITDKQKLKNQLAVAEERLNFNDIMSYTPSDNFKEIYRNVIVDENDSNVVKHIDIIYCRKYTDQTLENTKLKGEYIWIEIDYDAYKVWMHLSSKRSNQINRDLPSQPMILFNYFKTKLERNYGIVIEEFSEEGLIFKLYSYLTKKDEAKYVKRINEEKDKIEAFCDDMQDTLGIEDEENETLERVKGVLLRKIIQNDFDNFANNPNVEGRVKAFIFSDPEGTRLQASKGPGRSLIGDEINIESSTAYFDNKETINRAKKLFSVRIVWTPGYDNIDNYLQVRYTAYPGFLETHFLYSTITEDEYKNVLQKIRRIRENDGK